VRRGAWRNKANAGARRALLRLRLVGSRQAAAPGYRRKRGRRRRGAFLCLIRAQRKFLPPLFRYARALAYRTDASRALSEGPAAPAASHTLSHSLTFPLGLTLEAPDAGRRTESGKGAKREERERELSGWRQVGLPLSMRASHSTVPGKGARRERASERAEGEAFEAFPSAVSSSGLRQREEKSRTTLRPPGSARALCSRGAWARRTTTTSRRRRRRRGPLSIAHEADETFAC